jgi:hypothetical protein
MEMTDKLNKSTFISKIHINTTILKILIAIGLFAISALPEFWKELFVSGNGKFGNIGLFVAVFLTLGLYKNWKYTKPVIIILCYVLLIGAVISFLVTIRSDMYKPGYLIYTVILILTIYMTNRLTKIETTNK